MTLIDSARDPDPTACMNILRDNLAHDPFLTERGQTALHVAIELGHRDHILHLLHFLPQLLHTADGDGRMPFALIIESKSMALLRALFFAVDAENICLTDRDPVTGRLPLESALNWRDGLNFLQHQLRNDVIMTLCANGDVETFETFFFVDDVKMTVQEAIVNAILWNNDTLCFHLLDKIQDCFFVTKTHQSAFGTAVDNGNKAVLKFLLEKDFPPTLKTTAATTQASAFGDQEMLEILFKKGFPIDAKKSFLAMNCFRQTQCLRFVLEEAGVRVKELRIRKGDTHRFRLGLQTALGGAGCCQFEHTVREKEHVSLKDICRAKIRSLCHKTNVFHVSARLPLPRTLQVYLTFGVKLEGPA